MCQGLQVHRKARAHTTFPRPARSEESNALMRPVLIDHDSSRKPPRHCDLRCIFQKAERIKHGFSRTDFGPDIASSILGWSGGKIAPAAVLSDCARENWTRMSRSECGSMYTFSISMTDVTKWRRYALRPRKILYKHHHIFTLPWSINRTRSWWLNSLM